MSNLCSNKTWIIDYIISQKKREFGIGRSVYITKENISKIKDNDITKYIWTQAIHIL